MHWALGGVLWGHSVNHFKGGYDLLLFFGVWHNVEMWVACFVAPWSPGSECFLGPTFRWGACGIVVHAITTHSQA